MNNSASAQKRQVVLTYIPSPTRCDSATRSIDNYFENLKQLRMLEHITLDMLVKNCCQLVAVSRFLHGSNDELLNVKLEEQRQREKMRYAIIKEHISNKIKEYIDGKF